VNLSADSLPYVTADGATVRLVDEPAVVAIAVLPALVADHEL
jgi:hypothetical protein